MFNGYHINQPLRGYVSNTKNHNFIQINLFVKLIAQNRYKYLLSHNIGYVFLLLQIPEESWYCPNCLREDEEFTEFENMLNFIDDFIDLPLPMGIFERRRAARRANNGAQSDADGSDDGPPVSQGIRAPDIHFSNIRRSRPPRLPATFRRRRNRVKRRVKKRKVCIY